MQPDNCYYWLYVQSRPSSEQHQSQSHISTWQPISHNICKMPSTDSVFLRHAIPNPCIVCTCAHARCAHTRKHKEYRTRITNAAPVHTSFICELYADCTTMVIVRCSVVRQLCCCIDVARLLCFLKSMWSFCWRSKVMTKNAKDALDEMCSLILGVTPCKHAKS